MNLQRFRKIIFDLWVQPLCQLGDRLMPKKKNHWGFPVHHIKSEQFIENARAVFECVKTDPGIKKIIFCRSEKPEFELEGAKNTQVVLLQSWRGLVAIEGSESAPIDYRYAGVCPGGQEEDSCRGSKH